MAFDQIWETIHSSRYWGRYPNEHLVRYVCRRAWEPEARFLDLGCGAGGNTSFLRQEGHQVVALDGSVSAAKRAKGIVADALQLPFSGQAFDCVVDVVCLAHNEEPDVRRMIGEI